MSRVGSIKICTTEYGGKISGHSIKTDILGRLFVEPVEDQALRFASKILNCDTGICLS